MSESIGLFCQHLNWNYITKFCEGVVVQKDGALQRTFAYRAPDIDSSGAEEVNALACRVNDFSKRLGSGWALHFEARRFQIRDYPRSSFDSLAPCLIDREREAAFLAAGRHFDSYYYLTFTWRPPSESVKKLASVFVQSGAEGGDGAGLGQNVEFFAGESNSAASLLAGSLILAPLNNEETVDYLHSTISFNQHPIRFPHTSIMLDRILPDSELETSLVMKLGGFYIPIVGINDFPEESYPAILDGLNRARLEYRWVTRYICLDKEEGKKEAQKKEKAHRGSRKTFFQTFAESTSGEPVHAVNHGAGVKEEDSINAGIEIENDVASLGYLTTAVTVWDRDLKIAKKKADLVKTIINSKGFTCKDETFNALEAFKGSLPGNACSNYRALPVMSNTMSHIVPLSSVWAGLRHNAHAFQVTGVGTPHVVCSTIEGTPFFLNLAVGDVGHSAVWGPTGAGKSTLLNLLEMQFLKYPGSLVVVFDKGGSSRQPCLAAGGLFYEPAGENVSGVSFQPLQDLDSDRGVTDAMDFIEACIAVNGCAVTPPMRAAVKESLELLREKPRSMRTLTAFVHYANYQDETGRPVLKEMLGDYLLDGGKYGKIFDASASGISLDSRFIAFEMEALMNRGENCVAPALVCLFNLVEKKFDGRLALLVLDEAWLFLKNETFADKIAEWLKVLRKKNVYVVFATQEVSDAASSPLKTTVVQQCLTKIYLADPFASSPALYSAYREFGLSDPEISLISSAEMKRDYFYASPSGRRLFQLDLGPLSLALIGAPGRAELDRLSSQYEAGSALCAEILSSKRFDYSRFLDDDSPVDPVPRPRLMPVSRSPAGGHLRITNPGTPAPEEKPESPAAAPAEGAGFKNPPGLPAGFFQAVASLPERKSSSGSGRAAAAVAELYKVSLSAVYQARAVLKFGRRELADAMLLREIPVKTAYKLFLKERGLERAG